MIKRAVRALILIIITCAVLVSVALLLLNDILAPVVEKKIRQAIFERFDRRIEVERVGVKLPQAIVRIKGFELTDYSLGKYLISIKTGEVILHLSLVSTILQHRLIFDTVSMEGGKLLLAKTVPDISSPGQPISQPSVTSAGNAGFTEIYISKLRIKNSDFILRGCANPETPTTIEIVGIEGSMERLLVSLVSAGKFKGIVHLKGYFNSPVKGSIKIDGKVERRAKGVDFDIKSDIQNADLTYFSPYYANTSFTILKEARVDLASDIKCRNNELKTAHDAHIYNIKVNDAAPKPDDTLFSLPAATVINFFKDYGQDVHFSFKIVGMLNDPRFEPSPIIQDVLSKAMGDRIAARLKELPRDFTKMSERAIRGDLDIGKEWQAWYKEMETRFGNFMSEMEKRRNEDKAAE